MYTERFSSFFFARHTHVCSHAVPLLCSRSHICANVSKSDTQKGRRMSPAIAKHTSPQLIIIKKKRILRLPQKLTGVPRALGKPKCPENCVLPTLTHITMHRKSFSRSFGWGVDSNVVVIIFPVKSRKLTRRSFMTHKSVIVPRQPAFNATNKSCSSRRRRCRHHHDTNRTAE